MNVGDLVKWTDNYDSRNYYALVIKKDDWATLIKWIHTCEVEDADYYEHNEQWEIVSATTTTESDT